MTQQPQSPSVSTTPVAGLSFWLLLCLASCFLAYVARLTEVTHDAFHEMALVRQWVVDGIFPRSDVFAYTPTVSPAVHHEWATGAVLYFVTTTTGLGLYGLTILKLCLMATLWSVLYRVARLRGVHPYVFAIFAVVAFPMLWVGFATIRATLFTLVFLSIQLWMHEWDRRGHRLWIIAWWGMLVVWLNIHAGFLVGCGLLGIHAGERFLHTWYQQRSGMAAWRATWHLSLTGPLALVALTFNPYGHEYLPYLIKAISMPRPLIAEWWPLWYTHDPVITLAMFGLSLVLVVVSLRQQVFHPDTLRGGLLKRLRIHNLLGLLGLTICAYLAIKHLRHGSIYAVVWIAYGPAWLTHSSLGRNMVRSMKANPRLVTRSAQCLIACSVCWAIVHQFWITTVSGDTKHQSVCYPLGATRYLREHQFSGNLLTPFHAGAFVSWELYPQVKVSLDGRYEVAYAPSVFEQHWSFFEAEANWQELLDRYPHDAILVNQTAKVRPLLEAFRQPGSPWHFIYEDEAYVLLERTSNQHFTQNASGI